MQVKERSVTIDFIRCICMIFVVCILHFSQYTQYENWWQGELATWLTTAALAGFTFISGYLTYKSTRKYESIGRKYLLSRIIKIYPLFVLASILLFICGNISTLKELVFTIFLHGGDLITPSPTTVWYICMMFLFYLFVPLILNCKKWKKQLECSIIIYIALIIYFFCGNADYRLLLYFPFFCFGMLFNHLPIDKIKNKYIKFGMFVISLLVVFFMLKKVIYINLGFKMYYILMEFFSLVMLYILWYIANLINKISIAKVRRTVQIIGYSSFCMYLFHRPVYFCIQKICGQTIPIYGTLIIFPILVSLCYCINKLYDFVISEIIEKRKIKKSV